VVSTAKGGADLNEIQRYLAEEHVEDFRDGHISRRELLRRVTLILGSTAAATAFLAACGATSDVPRPAQPTAAAAPSAPAASAAASAVPYATPPAQTTNGITVSEDDPRINAGPLSPKAPDGAALLGYFARPRADGRYPGIVVVHENRGLQEHIKDVVRRAATAGFTAISIDLVSRDGGAEKLTDQAAYNAALGKRSAADMVKDLVSTLDFLRTQPSVNGSRLGVTGFCFGGGMVWSLLNAGASVQAAVPFYGPAPSDVSGIASTKAAVLAVYAEKDTRVTGGKDTIEPMLKKAGVAYQINIYPGVDHAFHNDTGRSYNADQARRAWVDTIDWFQRHLR
jgi:carboxymethylenebutenolidase